MQRTTTADAAGAPHADALVIFGITGDLAYKQIFPALQGLIQRGQLNYPIVGVAVGPWTIETLKERIHKSLEEHGGVDPAAFAQLAGQLAFVNGDYREAATFDRLRGALGGV